MPFDFRLPVIDLPRVNWRSPQSDGLVGWWPVGPFDSTGVVRAVVGPDLNVPGYDAANEPGAISSNPFGGRAVDLTAASSEAIATGDSEAGTPFTAIDAYPFMLSCRGIVNDVTTALHTLVSLNDGSSSTHPQFSIQIGGANNTTGNPADARACGRTSVHGMDSSPGVGSPAVGVPFHLAGAFLSNVDRYAYFNGARSGNANFNLNVDPSTLDRVAVGAWGDSTPNNYADGLVWDIRIYRLANTDVSSADSLVRSIVDQPFGLWDEAVAGTLVQVPADGTVTGTLAAQDASLSGTISSEIGITAALAAQAAALSGGVSTEAGGSGVVTGPLIAALNRNRRHRQYRHR